MTFDGSWPGIIGIRYILQDEPSIKVGSSWTTNVILRSLLSLCVRNYCDMEISM